MSAFRTLTFVRLPPIFYGAENQNSAISGLNIKDVMRCQSYSFEKTKDTKFTVKQIPHDTKKSEKKTTLR